MSATWSLSPVATLYLLLWYLASLVTLFMNKHILSTLRAGPQSLALMQMSMTCVMGAAKVHCTGGPGAGTRLAAMGASANLPLPSGAGAGAARPAKAYLKAMAWLGFPASAQFARDMVLVGGMRFFTVMAGLVALSFVPVSFVETIKSTAPLFTVAFATVLLREKTTREVQLSLIPVVSGLALASATELSFDALGFTAAVLNNAVDCAQNVVSKKLLASGRYNFVSLQYYTSAAALLVQVPVFLAVSVSGGGGGGSRSAGAGAATAATATSHHQDPADGGLWYSLPFCMLVDGLSYHAQSVFAYALMEHISPVTHSVANTVKRAGLIWLSIIVFGNPVTALNMAGCVLVLVGAFLYNMARSVTATSERPERLGANKGAA